MSKTHLSPHDRFYRSLMVKPKVAVEFFDKNLPEPLREIVDLNSLELQKESFIEDKLRLKIADLLYKVNFQERTGYLYVLLEHISSPSKWLPFTLLKYMIKIMDHHIENV